MAKISDTLKNTIKKKVLNKAVSSVSPSRKGSDTDVKYLRVIAKSFLSFSGIARDLNVSRQNIIKLVKIEGGTPVNKADAHFLKQAEREKALEEQMREKEDEGPSPKKEKPKKSLFQRLKESISKNKVMAIAVGAFSLAVIGTVIFTMFKDSIISWAKNLWKNIQERVGKFFDDLKNTILDSVNEMITSLKEKISGVIKMVSDFFSSIANWIGEKLNSVVNFFSKPIDFIKSAATKALSYLLDIGENIQKLKFWEKSEEEKKQPPEMIPEFPPMPEPTPPAPAPKPPAASTPKPSTTATPAAQAAPVAAGPESASTAAAPTPIASGDAVTQIVSELENSGITSKRAQGNILAQVAKESNFKPINENLEKWSAQTLFRLYGPPGASYQDRRGNAQTVPGHRNKVRFPSWDTAVELAKKGATAIGDVVYGGRMGNTSPGDGHKYRGRGYIQLTGKDAYDRIGKILGVNLVSDPDKVNEPEIAAKIVPAFFLRFKGRRPEDLEDINTVNRLVGAADPKSVQARVSLAADFESKLASGQNIGSTSTQVASNQRQQAKPQTPAVVDASTTNNTVVQNNKTTTNKSDTDTSKQLVSAAA
jgi:predicted chitinase